MSEDDYSFNNDQFIKVFPISKTQSLIFDDYDNITIHNIDNKSYSYFDDDINNSESQEKFNYNNNVQKDSFHYQQFLDGKSTGFATGKNLFNNLISDPNQNQNEEKEVNESKIYNNKNIIDEKNYEKYVERNEKFIKKKRKRSKNNNKVLKENKKCGRKRKKENNNKGVHSKYGEDNMITKIKIFIINAILVLLNNSFIYLNFNTASSQNRKFIKIEPAVYVPNKREINLRMLKFTIKDLLYNNISDKNFRLDKGHNKKLIDEIYSQQKEIDIIKILNLTFEEFLNFFRCTISNELDGKLSLITNVRGKFMNMWSFLDKTKEQEIKKGEANEDIDSYIEKLKYLCLNYENWFINKKGRKRDKKGKNNK